MANQNSLMAQAALLIAAGTAQSVADFEKSILECDPTPSEEIHAAIAPYFPQLNRLYEQYETELEQEFSARLLARGADVRQYALYDRFFTLISNEVALGRFKPEDHVAMIGSGPFPISAIILRQSFGIRVTAIDHNPHAADVSRKVILALGLDKGIEVQSIAGHQWAPQNIRGAIVALLAKQKGAILQNLFQPGSPCASVICRTSHGLRQALYAPADASALAPYKLRDTHLATADQTISSLLLTR